MLLCITFIPSTRGVQNQWECCGRGDKSGEPSATSRIGKTILRGGSLDGDQGTKCLTSTVARQSPGVLLL